MMASADGLGDLVADPPDGLLWIEDAMRRAVDESAPTSGERPWPTRTTSPTPTRSGPVATPDGCGKLASVVTPSVVQPVLGPDSGFVPGPVAGAVRTGLDTMIGLVPRGVRRDHFRPHRLVR